MNEPSTIPTGIHWPEGMDESRFLKEYWQQKPLLIRQTFPDFQTPLDANELAGLSLEPNTTPRLITQDEHGDYHLEHGPFEDDRFESLQDNNWSLLVTDVEKHVPELAPYLRPFQFLPNWRIDDLMVSYAPVGASVGAHVDEYDVFLLQASGRRQWSIDQRITATEEHALLPNSTLKILANFLPTDTWDLNPGDMLYLPPGMPHHGIAVAESCTTWSIGFRAPAIPDMVMRISEMLSDSLPSKRFTDGALDIATPGEISAEAVARMKAIWTQATTLDDASFAEFVGALLTESGSVMDGESYDDENDFEAADTVVKAPFSQFAWYRSSDLPADISNTVTLFVNGEKFNCSESLAIELCQGDEITVHTNSARNASDQALLEDLMSSGCIVPA